MLSSADRRETSSGIHCRQNAASIEQLFEDQEIQNEVEAIKAKIQGEREQQIVDQLYPFCTNRQSILNLLAAYPGPHSSPICEPMICWRRLE